MSSSVVPAGQRKLSHEELAEPAITKRPGPHETQGESTTDKFVSRVPLGHMSESHEPFEPAGTKKPGWLQLTHDVLAFMSSSVVPAGQTNMAHGPLELAGTKLPAGHATQAVAGFESSSVVPSPQTVQEPELPLAANDPAGHATHGV